MTTWDFLSDAKQGRRLACRGPMINIILSWPWSVLITALKPLTVAKRAHFRTDSVKLVEFTTAENFREHVRISRSLPGLWR